MSVITANKFKYRKGVILSFIAGIFSSMLNFAFEAGNTLREQALLQFGTTSVQSNALVWLIALSGGCIPFIIYCVYLLSKNSSWNKFTGIGWARNFILALLMGLLFFSSVMCYGWAASSLGKVGSTIGWIIFMSGALLTANLWGLFLGEWEGASNKAKTSMFIGSLLLILTIVLVSYGNSKL